jgi:hypothetical protein
MRSRMGAESGSPGKSGRTEFSPGAVKAKEFRMVIASSEFVQIEGRPENAFSTARRS